MRRPDDGHFSEILTITNRRSQTSVGGSLGVRRHKRGQWRRGVEICCFRLLGDGEHEIPHLDDLGAPDGVEDVGGESNGRRRDWGR
jgi:hypothetical protein